MSHAARCRSLSRKGIGKEYGAKASAASARVPPALAPAASGSDIGFLTPSAGRLIGMTLRDPRLGLDVLPVLLWTTGPDGACDYLNDRWTEFTGRPVSEMLGWRWSEYLHPDDREAFQAEYAAALASRS